MNATERHEKDINELIAMHAPPAEVPGEPSLGTPHPHEAVILNVVPTSTDVQTLDISGEVPEGTTMVALVTEIDAGTVGRTLIFTNAAGTANYGTVRRVTGTVGNGMAFPLVDANRKIYWKVNNVDVTLAWANMILYWWG